MASSRLTMRRPPAPWQSPARWPRSPTGPPPPRPTATNAACLLHPCAPCRPPPAKHAEPHGLESLLNTAPVAAVRQAGAVCRPERSPRGRCKRGSSAGALWDGAAAVRQVGAMCRAEHSPRDRCKCSEQHLDPGGLMGQSCSHAMHRYMHIITHKQTHAPLHCWQRPLLEPGPPAAPAGARARGSPRRRAPRRTACRRTTCAPQAGLVWHRSPAKTHPPQPARQHPAAVVKQPAAEFMTPT